jgi:hypothetical protein
MNQPDLPLEHFTLQSQYAYQAVRLGMSWQEALMTHTQFWRRVHNTAQLKAENKQWSFDSNTPEWQEFIRTVSLGEQPDVTAYNMYIRNFSDDESSGKAYFGCFRYDFNPVFKDQWEVLHRNVIKIHFRNNEISGFGPLSKLRREIRKQELTNMFTDVRARHPNAEQVHGGSWVYNFPPYRSLFPEKYTSNMLVEEVPFPRTSGIWGQFLNSEGSLKIDLADQLLKSAQLANSFDQLLQCFPYKILFPRAPIQVFYDFYGIS